MVILHDIATMSNLFFYSLHSPCGPIWISACICIVCLNKLSLSLRAYSELFVIWSCPYVYSLLCVSPDAVSVRVSSDAALQATM